MGAKLHIKKNDIVKVISGDYKGKEGRVLKVFPKENKAIVEGINIAKKHTKPTPKLRQGGIIEKEMPIHISNLMVIDSTGKPTRIGRRLNKDGKLVRYSKKTGEEIK